MKQKKELTVGSLYKLDKIGLNKPNIYRSKKLSVTVYERNTENGGDPWLASRSTLIKKDAILLCVFNNILTEHAFSIFLVGERFIRLDADLWDFSEIYK